MDSNKTRTKPKLGSTYINPRAKPKLGGTYVHPLNPNTFFFNTGYCVFCTCSGVYFDPATGDYTCGACGRTEKQLRIKKYLCPNCGLYEIVKSPMVADEYICNDCHYDPGCEPSRWRVVVHSTSMTKPNNVFNGTIHPGSPSNSNRPTNTHISGPNLTRTTFNSAKVEKAATSFWIDDEVPVEKVTPGNDIVSLKGDRQRKLIQEAKERKPFSLESIETSFEDFMKEHKKISSGFDEVFRDYLRSVGYNFKKNSISCREESKHKDAYNYFLYRQKNLTV